MGKCLNFDSATYVQCSMEAVKEGLCSTHYDAIQQAKQLAKQPISPKAIQKTSAELKKHFGALGSGTSSSAGGGGTPGGKKSKKDGDSTGGVFLGGASDEPHVHQYGGNGAHVKVGEIEYRFIRPDAKGSFDEAEWDKGIAAVKSRNLPKKILAAMATTLCDYGGLGNAALETQLSKLA